MALMDRFKEWLGCRKSLEAPPDTRVKFLLKYEGNVIGTLSVEDGVWKFKYSDEFRRHDLRPIVGFPDTSRIYESKALWQFFASRIPSPEQPDVEAILRREHISEDDPVSLLKRFGARTIANPFQLEVS